MKWLKQINLRLIGTLLFFVIFLYALFSQANSENKIKKDHLLVCGKILSVTASKGGAYIASYEYLCNGKLIKETNGWCKLVTKDKFDKGEYYILIAIDKHNCNNIFLLEEKGDFERLNITDEEARLIDCKN